MTALTRLHGTTSYAAGMWHLWTVSDGQHKVTLSALHTMHLDMPGVPAAGRDQIAVTGNGAWVLDVIGIQNGDYPDALTTEHARSAWDQIVAAGVTDDAVFAQLDQVYGQVFGGAA